jgi:predicted transcriptional regulator
MGTRTVRLDEDAERTLSRLRKATGLSISEVLKRGLEAYEKHARHEGSLRPYEVYRRLDLGAGGWSRAAAADAKHAVAEVIRRKHRKKISGQRGAVHPEPPSLANTRTRKDP